MTYPKAIQEKIESDFNNKTLEVYNIFDEAVSKTDYLNFLRRIWIERGSIMIFMIYADYLNPIITILKNLRTIIPATENLPKLNITADRLLKTAVRLALVIA